jgi:hypothetical protein
MMRYQVNHVAVKFLTVGVLTSKWKKFGIYIFESEFIDGSTGALLLECSVHPSYFIFGELGGSSDVIQVVRAIPHYWTSQTLIVLHTCIWSTEYFVFSLYKEICCQ